MTHRDQLHEEHVKAWGHCLRCKLAEARLQERSASDKYVGRVPVAGTMESCYDSENPDTIPQSPVMFLLSHPDLLQEKYGNVWGNMHLPKATWPPQVAALLNTFYALGDTWTPYQAREISLGVAVGCRPMNYKDIRKTTDPSAEVNKACGPRWHAEVRMVDPHLVISMGHHAYTAICPKAVRRQDYVKAIGEVIPFTLHGGRSSVTYSAYIAPDPNEVAMNARKDQWVRVWKGKPPRSETKEMVDALRWHVMRGMWIARVLEAGRGGRPLQDDEVARWKAICGALDASYGSKADVISAEEYVLRKIERSTSIELSMHDVRRAQAGAQTSPDKVALVTHTFIPEVKVLSRRQRKELEDEEAQ